MIGDCADRTEGADKHAILSAVGADSRIGGKYLRPGYGFGGESWKRERKTERKTESHVILVDASCHTCEWFSQTHTFMYLLSRELAGNTWARATVFWRSVIHTCEYVVSHMRMRPQAHTFIHLRSREMAGNTCARATAWEVSRERKQERTKESHVTLV